ncbi:MAG: thiosulfate oxidation carrier protein SoxY [Salipiger thiooxidans]|uniref:thiosulfate oxidation carrier protein SoxY n=1 Tax=Salipiger thiooxidans TaxID=282683 RepID=UPI001CF9BAD7|nr:thiosulfate oxidation carrier protein SoxY [Salipiger thiooxidans]MBR9837754.1 hypothetical protein [Paracoccaceae bacterium]
MRSTAAMTLDRRGFLVATVLAGTAGAMPFLAAEPEPMRLTLTTETGGTGLRYRVLLENPASAPAPVRSVQVFALGERQPLLASFDIDPDAPSAEMSGPLDLGREQNVMALVRLDDGTMLHARSHVSAASG